MSIRTSDLCDQFSDQVVICTTAFQSYGIKKAFTGKISTVKIYSNDNQIFMEAIEQVTPGTVLVLDGAHNLAPCAWMGDRKAGIAASRGVTGIIINGLVRDIEGLAYLDIGVLALGSHPLSSRFVKKEQRGVRDVILDFGNVDWVPGHYVYADQDGVVISEKELSV
ncbi:MULTISPECIES: ribonuclease E activity regulator RraA [unclassified Paenibacillus]|uniref:ribonuclease E activity regulator RraA n=1 Tax=unclassified Paenibacillus TaxID=185978 RepID=UPI001B49828D|nr:MULTISPECIES: ribonuclease E activity regulator RraA [unclassified Paenibacillus]MBP1155848.1 regulator of ribonuclease activity A [Paenibacillus sp. PvP091]MBP1168766.1 regulator of ribonuclease activity A [Paenibacillus sp. PvR098]MBP2439794.1 regulator of ribonuclease activity A [Paenibacillus sp. PvP052]